MSVEEFNDFLQPLLFKLTKEGNKPCYIDGDFNIDLLKTTSHPPSAKCDLNYSTS